jgi:hypothetical protein
MKLIKSGPPKRKRRRDKKRKPKLKCSLSQCVLRKRFLNGRKLG